MIRWIGAFCVVFATSYIGVEYSRNLQKRIYQLLGLKKIFTDLYSDVEYGACTLIESFERISRRQDPLYRNFLNEICYEMKSGKGNPFETIIAETVKNLLAESALRESDKNELIQLGRHLGNDQRNGQLRILQLYLRELDERIEELEKTKQEKQKLGRVLGISSGVLIVILLL